MAKKHLGKGIEALLSSVSTEIQKSVISEGTQQTVLSTSVVFIETNKLIPSPFQPRKSFEETKLQELANSIKQSGIIEPLIVSPLPNGNFEIVCGERRWRAAKLINLDTVPVVIKQLDDKQKRLLSLIENLQREDLNPVEEAEAYKNLIEEYNLTQEELSQFVGKDRSVIANTLRILSLPQQVIDYIRDGLISAGHARSLASIKDPNTILELAKRIVEDKLTVRDIENIVRMLKTNRTGKQKTVMEIPEVKNLQKKLSELLGVKVVIKPTTNTKGKIIISYSSLDEFDKIVKKLER